jgi:hypothetical protein
MNDGASLGLTCRPQTKHYICLRPVLPVGLKQMLTYSIRKIPTLKQIVRCKIFADLFILTSMVSVFFYGNGKIAQILENDTKKKTSLGSLYRK